MKKLKFWYPLAAVVFGMGVSIAASYPAIKNIKAERAQTQHDILNLDNALNEALLKKDLDRIADLLSDDFELYTITHGVLNKAQFLEEIRSGKVSYTEFSNKRMIMFKGKQVSAVVNISGNFWGYQADNYPVEMSIRAMEYKDKQRIKCITVKDVRNG